MATQWRWWKNPGKWWASAKRRTPGVYAFRTRQHANPRRTEWGYVGESLHLASRRRDHEGTGRYKHAAKEWMDLVVSYRALRLPWWLGWKPVILTLEAAAIMALRPRYNDRNNPRPDKVRKLEQATQRAERNARPADWAPTLAARISWPTVLTGALLILVGVAGWWVTR